MKAKLLLALIIGIYLIGLVSASLDEELDINTPDESWNGTALLNGHSMITGGWTFLGGAGGSYTNAQPKPGNTLSIALTGAGLPEWKYTNNSVKSKYFTVWLYDEDDASATFSIQNHDGGANTVHVGVNTGTTIGNYVCYNGIAQNTNIGRSVGWHNFTIFRPDGGNSIQIYIDNVNATVCAQTINLIPGFSTINIYSGDDDVWFSNFSFWNESDGAPAPPAPGSINVTIVKPQNGSTVGIINLTSGNLFINYTKNDTSSCIINDTRWDNYADDNITLKGAFINNTLIPEGHTTVNVSCINNTIWGGDVSDFILDISTPIINPTDTLANNQTLVWNGTLGAQINFTDNIEIYSIMVNFTNASGIFHQTNMGVTHYELNISNETQDNTYIDVRVCDGHTAKEIKNIERIDIDNNGLKYVIEDNPLWEVDKTIHIYPKDSSSFTTPNTVKLTDRYVFTFNKKTTALATETFVVESSSYIDIIKGQKYGGHLVIPNLGENGYWIDFVNDKATKYEIKRINDNKVEVTIYGLKGTKFEFNSVGELNCVEARYYWGILTSQEGWVDNVLIGETTDFNLNITINDLITTTNATLFYNNTPYYTGTIANFTQSVTVPEDVLGNSTNISWNWLIETNVETFNLTTRGQNVSNFFLENCTVFTNETLNFTMRNITNDNILTGPMEFTIDYTYGTTTKIYSTSVTDDSATFCIYPPWITLTADITTEYSSGDSALFNNFYDDIVLNNISQDETLYITSGTTLITFTVYDENDNKLPDALINVLEYDVGTDTYKTSQILTTDSEGKAYGNLVLNEVWYKFIIEYNGDVVLTTTNTKQVETTRDFRVIIGTVPESILLKLNQLDITLEVDRPNKNFTLVWNDINYLTSEISLVVTTNNLTSNISIISTESSSADSGTLTYHITDNTTSRSISYLANVYVISTDDNNSYLVTSGTMDFKKEWDIFGTESLFATFIFVGTMTFIGVAISATAAIVLTMFAMVVLWTLGFYMLSASGLVAIIIALLIYLIKVNR